MTQRPPQRLLDDPGVAAQLRGDLATARAHHPPYDAGRGLSALGSTLDGLEAGVPLDSHAMRGGEVLQPSSGAAWSEGLRVLAGRWWGWTATGIATVGAVWWVQHAPLQTTARGAASSASTQVEAGKAASAPQSDETRKDTAVAAAPDTSAVEPARHDLAEPARVAERVPVARARSAALRTSAGVGHSRVATAVETRAPVQHEAASPSDADGAINRASAAVSSRASVQQTGMAEVEHLARVRGLLKTAPHEALAAARDGQKTFANGLFVEERAGLIVFALAALGREDEALREGRRFLHAHPEGPFVARVRGIVARIEGPPR